MLRASIIGNLGGDAEVRYTSQGEELVSLSVAVNQRKRIPESSEWKESTNWIRVRCSGWRAEAAKKLSKGQRVYVCGRLEINDYVRRDGSPGVSYDVWADELHAMGAPKADSPNGTAAREPAVAAPVEADNASTSADLVDLPFHHPRWMDEPWLSWHENL